MAEQAVVLCIGALDEEIAFDVLRIGGASESEYTPRAGPMRLPVMNVCLPPEVHPTEMIFDPEAQLWIGTGTETAARARVVDTVPKLRCYEIKIPRLGIGAKPIQSSGGADGDREISLPSFDFDFFEQKSPQRSRPAVKIPVVTHSQTMEQT